MTGQENGDLLI